MSGLLIWLGPDRALKRQRLEALRATHQIDLLDRHVLEATLLTAPEILTLAREQPAASPARLIVVDDAHRLSAACIQALAASPPTAFATAWVVLLVDVEVEARHPLQALLPQATVERFLGSSEDPRAGVAGGFALVDAIAQRNAAGALSALQEQLAQGKDPLELLGLVAWQLQRWLTVKELLAAGVRGDRLSTVSGLRDWQLERAQHQVRGRSVEALRRQLEIGWQVDRDAKRGRTLPRVALEQLVIELCLPVEVGAG